MVVTIPDAFSGLTLFMFVLKVQEKNLKYVKKCE